MHADGSSSPSGSLLVVSFARRGTGGERWELHLSDGSSFFVSSESLRLAGVAPQELAPGVELEQAKAERLLDSSRWLEARDKALELLAGRSHAVQELRLKLEQRRFEPRHIDRILAWLEERGYLDDREFARQWAGRRVDRHPEGKLALLAGLRRRGVSREVAEEVLAGICSAESEREAARAALAALRRRSRAGGSSGPGEVARLRRALQRRGFRTPLILDLLPYPGAGEREPGDPGPAGGPESG